MDEVIQTENLTVRYGLREALTSLTVRITKGAVGLLGPNGAGKSTLIKTLLGLLHQRPGRPRF